MSVRRDVGKKDFLSGLFELLRHVLVLFDNLAPIVEYWDVSVWVLVPEWAERGWCLGNKSSWRSIVSNEVVVAPTSADTIVAAIASASAAFAPCLHN